MIVYTTRLRRFVTMSMTELKRIDGATRSPVFDHFTASMRGLICIRAFGRETEVQRRMVTLLDAHARSWFWWLICNRFLGFRLDMLVVIVMACATLGGALIRHVMNPE